MKTSKVIFRYVTYKRALGYRFCAEEAILRAFSISINDKPIATIGKQDVLTFLNGSGPITVTWGKKHRVLSGLFRFLISRGLAEFSPMPTVIPKSTVTPFVPYIYSHDELRRLLNAVPDACGGRASIEDYVFRALILLLYGAGLRIGEALALTLEDVDLEEAYCCVRETKFFKSRLVPLGGDLKGVLTDYLAQRNKSYGSARDASVFCSCNGLPLSQSSVRSAFRRLRSHAGVLREGGPRRQPRLHDLRHTAAVHRLSAWYRSGEDMHQLLPKLATYLGHLDLSGTQCYLTLTPELLSQASQRFERYVMEPNHD
jgi:site-specific recombinase XerD